MTDWQFGELQPGHYNVIEADPPWDYKTFTQKGEGRSARRHYRTMTLTEIKALPVADLAAKDCHLFLWTTGPNLKSSFGILDAWGFQFSSMAFVWVKLNTSRADSLFFVDADFFTGMGHTTRKNVEICLLGRKGSPKRLRKDVRELIIAGRREHSRKPDIAYERIRMYADGPRCCLFAREDREGFEVWGDEPVRFNPLRRKKQA